MTPRYLDPKWRYIPAVATDIRKTFARERKRLREMPAVLRSNRRVEKGEAS